MFRARLVSLACLFLLPLALIFGRLWHVQVLHADELRDAAADALQRVRFYPGRRGSILAAGGEVLVSDQPTFDVTFRLAELDPTILPAGWLAHYLELPKPDVRRQLLAGGGFVLRVPAEEKPLLLARLRRRIPALEVDADTLSLNPELCGQLGRSLALLAELCGEPRAALEEKVEQRLLRIWERDKVIERRIGLSSPYILVRGLEAEAAWTVAERTAALPGIAVETHLERRFPQGELAAHVLGFLGRLDGGDVARLRGENKREGLILEDRRHHLSGLEEFVDIRGEAHFMDDAIGKTGLEALYEERLRGRPGAEWVEMARGERVTAVLDAVKPEPGQDLHLHLMLPVQRAAESTLAQQVDKLWSGRKDSRHAEGGAALLMDARTGALRAVASYPSFSPITRQATDPLAGLLGPRAAFMNRVSGATYATGSVFKVYTAYEALARGTLAPGRRILCQNALFPSTPNRWRCPNHAYGLQLDVCAALQYSCNVFFYTVGEHCFGPGELAGGARSFGFGAATGVDLPGERAGLLPDAGWKREAWHHAQQRFLAAEARGEGLEAAAAQKRYWDDRSNAWLPGDSRNLAIGQGDLLATPLQVGVFLAALANGGKVLEPRIAAHVPPAWREIPIDPGARATVLRGLEQVVQAGTASRHALRELPYRVAAKTGTAQAGRGTDHAWLAGWAPAERPEVVFVVLVEKVPEGIHGGEACSPVAAAMLEAYFGGQR